MAKILQFPSTSERNWSPWEASIRQSYADIGIDDRVVSHAIPRMREHWLAIFEATDLELPKRAVPGKLTEKQAAAIQSIINDAASVVVQRLQQERILAFQRLLDVEIEVSLLQITKAKGTE